MLCNRCYLKQSQTEIYKAQLAQVLFFKAAFKQREKYDNTQTQSTRICIASVLLGYSWSHPCIIWNILRGFSVHVTRLVFNVCYRQLPEMMK